jgi:3-methyladenine DNA glycosylase AlkC
MDLVPRVGGPAIAQKLGKQRGAVAITVDQVLESVRGKSVRSMRALCFELSRTLQPASALELAQRLMPNPDVHGAMAATLIAGHISYLLPEALQFLRNQSAAHADVRVQECLARGFDHYCLNKGYERALAVMEEWSKDPNENVRRAVIEAPRPWTKKDYFVANPKVAFSFVSGLKSDPSGTVRFSVGRALSEMGDDLPELLLAELKTWNVKDATVKHTYMFASKNLQSPQGASIFTAVPKKSI